MHLDWTVNINTLLLALLSFMQVMFVLGRYFMKNEDKAIATQAEVYRVERELEFAQQECKASLLRIQREIADQYRTLSSVYVTSAEFRMFVRGREQYETGVLKQLDEVNNTLRDLRNNHES